MAGTQDYDLGGLDPQMQEEILGEMEEQKEEDLMDGMELNQEVQELYGSPSQDEKHNQHTFLNKAVMESDDTVRTTFLSESELGRPLFNIRFLLDLHDLSKYYLDPILTHLGKDPNTYNGIANYFWDKTQNITSSGQSNKGFSMNLSVTQKRDNTRIRLKNPTDNLKGGKK